MEAIKRIIIDPELLSQLPSKDVQDDPVVYVADSANNCIRRINLRYEITETVAGVCG